LVQLHLVSVAEVIPDVGPHIGFDGHAAHFVAPGQPGTDPAAPTRLVAGEEALVFLLVVLMGSRMRSCFSSSLISSLEGQNHDSMQTFFLPTRAASGIN